MFRETVDDPLGFVLRLHLLTLRFTDGSHFGWIKRANEALDLVVAVPLIFRFELLLRSMLFVASPLFFLARLPLLARFERSRWKDVSAHEGDVEAGRIGDLAVGLLHL